MSTSHGEDLGFKAHWKCLLAVTLVSMSQFQYGLDFGIIGGLQAMIGFLTVFGEPDPMSPIGWNLPHERQQLIASLMTLGSFVTSGTAGFTALYLGRKPSLWVACALVFVSTAVMQTTETIGGLYAGRVIIGLANGLLMTQSQLWIQESIPALYRGLSISALMAWTAIGSIIGTVVNNYGARDLGRYSYVMPLGICHIMPALLAVGLFLVPESPRWLLERGRAAQAEASLRWLRPAAGWSVDAELREMTAALASEREMQRGVGVVELFRNPVDRRRTLLSIAVITSQAGSGSMYIFMYGTYFFLLAGIGNPFENTIILLSVGMVAVIINSLVIVRWGRRRVFMIAGLIGCGLTQLIMASVYTASPLAESTGKTVVAMSVLYLVCYNAGLASYAWVAAGEIPSQRLRSHTFGIATAVGFVWAWLTTFTAPYFINPDSLNWGPKYGFIWTGSCAVCALFVFFFLPELKDRTLEEVDELFEARLPARKFRQYQCQITKEAGEDKVHNVGTRSEERIEEAK